ncbi:MAG: enoyl-CoA hydratase/isomerase family protein [Parvibaculum sp.]|nr:enoyl-CoA hydratase/isomerase family protein [Parvibaculum sp.]
MSFEHIVYEQQGRVATITLNRPARLNAIASGMPREIAKAVEMANEDDGVHVIVLTGAGRAFCAGGSDIALCCDMVVMADDAKISYPPARVEALAERMAGVPRNQLMMQKLLVNQAYENMGLQTTQMFATLFDGITRHSPEGVSRSTCKFR